ncbi:hypothetical protein OCT63_05540 [Vibrio sp. RW]|uniref:glycosyl hydrolase 2 galactose-binding domain-containing protein n=1 Tax=Vibrio sp. RW TaxID=2998833 RepID=UPI0022CD705C|nr:hypothetical protein [Vibrio sp. RW]MDA0143702.1 hypothetical protein [Vibrio sp. RW]
MQLPLDGFWQISPLTDLSIPQDDITFPAPLSSKLPDHLSEEEIAEQEWHLMHDIEVDDAMLACSFVELVVAGVDYFAEVRLNGVAVFDCDGSEAEYRKDIRPYMQLGRNRFEILFLEEEESLLLEEDMDDSVSSAAVTKSDSRIGIWHVPYLQFVRNVKLEQVVTEQIWHHGGGCEFKVDVIYRTLKAGLVSASIKFNGMTLVMPIDVRAEHTGVVFQVEAPVLFDLDDPNPKHLYQLEVELDGQKESSFVALNPASCVSNFLRN